SITSGTSKGVGSSTGSSSTGGSSTGGSSTGGSSTGGSVGVSVSSTQLPPLSSYPSGTLVCVPLKFGQTSVGGGGGGSVGGGVDELPPPPEGGSTGSSVGVHSVTTL